MLRSFTVLFLVCMCAWGVRAQQLRGRMDFPGSAGGYVVLFATRGEQHVPLDSVRIGRNGAFAFPAPFRSTGFYELAVHDSDRVDIILDPREPLVDVEFAGLPLQRHITVRTSDENKRLWEYKLVSRETQAVEATVAAEKRKLQPDDLHQLRALDSTLARAQRMRAGHLDRLLRAAPGSYFAQVVSADKALDNVREMGPMAVADVFDFGSPALLHASVYDKAVMTFLRNVNAVTEEQFVVACDSLMQRAGKDPECKGYMLDHLIGLFATYGPDMAVQHLVDRYVVPSGSSANVAPELRAKVEELMKLSVGAIAPDIVLPSAAGPMPLAPVLARNKYTALFFYSSTCDHCHAQMPGLKEDYDAYHGKGFEVIGIALDADSTEFGASIRDNAIPWPCYSEFNGWGSQAAKAYQVRSTPTFFLIDAQRRIVAKPYNADDLGRQLHALLD